MSERDQLIPVEEALEELRRGRFVVVVADERETCEGHLLIAGEHANAEAITFMAIEAGGLICLALTAERCDTLGLTPLKSPSELPLGTDFMVTIEAREGVSTGISAQDRARTVEVAIDPMSTARDLVRPGHILPLRARQGGVIERPLQTEAAVDLARLAGLTPAGVICGILDERGDMARLPELMRWARGKDISVVSIASVVEHRGRHETVAVPVSSDMVSTAAGPALATVLQQVGGERIALALQLGDAAAAEASTLAVRRESLVQDVFGRDAGEQEAVRAVLEQLTARGRGLLVYLLASDRTLRLRAGARVAHDAWSEAQFVAAVARALSLDAVELLEDSPALDASLRALAVDVRAPAKR